MSYVGALSLNKLASVKTFKSSIDPKLTTSVKLAVEEPVLVKVSPEGFVTATEPALKPVPTMVAIATQPAPEPVKVTTPSDPVAIFMPPQTAEPERQVTSQIVLVEPKVKPAVQVITQPSGPLTFTPPPPRPSGPGGGVKTIMPVRPDIPAVTVIAPPPIKRRVEGRSLVVPVALGSAVLIAFLVLRRRR